MAIRPILIHPDPRLKKTCLPVATVDRTVRQLMEDMLETMYAAPGIGLAAPQVGVLKRVLVMDCSDKEGPPEPIRMVNPEVTWSSEEENLHEEGCLSIPDTYAEVTRPSAVRVRWTDERGERQEEQFEGLYATCVQHEIDHLNGRLFIDYLGAVKRGLITTKMRKLKKARATA
ncbi:MAG: peptide deformylase [Pseudomonadota bacterium]